MQHPANSWTKLLPWIGGWWVFLFVEYLLLAGEMSVVELIAGAIASMLATVALAVVRLKGGRQFGFRLAWLAPLSRAPLAALRGCWKMLVAICARANLSRSAGRLDEIEFRPGNDLPSCKGRRALVTEAVSLAPDSFVLDIDRHAHRLILHRYGPPSSKPLDPEWPI